jgi:hypothetical protein
VTVERRTVVLGVAAAGAVAAAIVVTTVSHRSTGSRQRKDVAAYIEQVNALQNRMHAPLARVMLAYSSYGKTQARRPSVAQLAAAAATLTALQKQLAALACPPEARTLRAKLLTLVHREAEITQEVRLLSRFAPRYTSTLGAVHNASLVLDAQLKKIDVPVPHVLRGTKQTVARAQRAFQAKAQRAAIDDYDRTVAQLLQRLTRMRPPPALAPQYRAQVVALRDVTFAGTELARRLRGAQRSDVAALARRFSLASRAAGTIDVQRAQIAAIRAYNKRARQVGTAAGAVQAELARLQRDLP